MDDNLRRRIESKVRIEGDHWIWTGATNPHGKPIMSTTNKSPGGYKLIALGNRLIYEEYVGPIPDGGRIYVDCDRQDCVKPEHLVCKEKITREPKLKATHICIGCGIKPAQVKYCDDCRKNAKSKRPEKRPKYLWKLKQPLVCSRCGFVPENPVQLDVDHKDGNRENDVPSNYQLLCVNCHRLKTHANKDYQRKPQKTGKIPQISVPDTPPLARSSPPERPFRAFPKKQA